MDDPVKDIPGVIRALTQSPPSAQRAAIDKYFAPDATFLHPFCRTPPLKESRWIIHGIYRWYKVLSPRIDLDVHSVAYDAPNLRLYVTISQVFRIWFVPFYKAPVTLVTVLDLAPAADGGKYLIRKQNDLYQTDQFPTFIPFLSFLWVFVVAWQYFATLFSVVGGFVLQPVSWVAENKYPEGWKGIALE